MRRKNLLERHAVTMLGVATMVIPGFLGIDGLIVESHRKYWLAAAILLGAITTQRGTAQVKQDKQAAP